MPLFLGREEFLALLDTTLSPFQHLQVYGLLAALGSLLPRVSCHDPVCNCYGSKLAQDTSRTYLNCTPLGIISDTSVIAEQVLTFAEPKTNSYIVVAMSRPGFSLGAEEAGEWSTPNDYRLLVAIY